MTMAVAARDAGHDRPANTPAHAAELLALLQTYNEVTERLKRSHEVLQREAGRLREELEAKNRELARRERLAALGEMAAGLAHEIRNPLGGIRLYASLLERDLVDRPAQCDMVHRLAAGVHSLERLVSDVLAFAGDREPVMRAVRVSELFRELRRRLGPAGETTGCTVDVSDGNVGGTLIRCDRDHLCRALLNLVLNAVEAAEVSGRVWVRAERRDGGKQGGPLCHLTVEDNGPGVPTEYLQRVFHPFFTTRANGTGLGLAIVHRIAEAGGGWVRAANRAEGGARFVLAVPLAGRPVATGIH